MSSKLNTAIAVAGIDIGKNSFHVIGLDKRGAIVLRQKWSRGQVEARLANTPPCLIGMEACVGAHHLSRKLQALGHDARLMPAKYVRPYSKGQKNDFRLSDPPPCSFSACACGCSWVRVLQLVGGECRDRSLLVTTDEIRENTAFNMCNHRLVRFVDGIRAKAGDET